MRTLDPPPNPARSYAAAAISLALALAFGRLFYAQYWTWRECIEQSLSSCVTPDGGNLTAGGMVWGFPVPPLLLTAAYQLRRAARLRREKL